MWRGRIRFGLAFVAVILLVVIVVAWASTSISNTAVMTYTNAAGTAIAVPGNTEVSVRLDPPVGAGAPASFLPGQESTRTVTMEISPDYPTQTILLPTVGATYVTGSLVITGATGTITDTTAAGVTVSFSKPTAVKAVTCTYKVKWN
jgi:hypothetical protein